MPTALRDSLLLVCGVLLGIVVGAAIILFLNLETNQAEAPSSEPPAAAAEPTAPSTAQMGAGPGPAATAQPQAVAASQVSCPLRPLLAAVGPKDGQLLPPADVARTGMDEAERMLLAGKEAQAAGQVRDAEVAYLTSCRIADARKGAGSVEAANARYQLARHYAGLAAAEGNAPASEREELRRRAKALYEHSLQNFSTALGPAHEKTRFATDGLAALQPAVTQGASPAPATAATRSPPAPPTAAAQPPTPAPVPAGRSPAAGEPDTARTAQPAASRQATRNAEPATRPQPRPSEPPVRQATGDPGVSSAPEPAEPSARPSFDCSRARSVPERIICGDAELSQLDRDLSRLHARAKNAAPDAVAFKRQNDNEWRRRESTCRDRECLLDWYGERRRQLQAELSDSGGRAQAASR